MEVKVVTRKKCRIYKTPLRIALSGKMAAGKTVLARRMAKVMNMTVLSFGSYVKSFCSTLSNYNKDKDLSILMPMLNNLARINNVDIKDLLTETLSLANKFDGINYSWTESSQPIAEVKTKEIRNMIQTVGHTIRSKFNDDFWINCLIKNLEFNGRYVVDDVRYPNELQALVDNGFFVIRINVNKEDQIKRLIARDGEYSETALIHPSEVLLDKANFDIYVNNNIALPNYLARSLSAVIILDTVSNKLYELLRNKNTDDYRRNVLMEFENISLETRTPNNDNSCRYRSSNGQEYFT